MKKVKIGVIIASVLMLVVSAVFWIRKKKAGNA
jgi:hypothetical protein